MRGRMFRTRESRERVNPFVGKPKESNLKLSTTELESILAHQSGSVARPWTQRERVAFSVDTPLSCEEALATPDVDMDAEWLIRRGVRSEQLRAAQTPILTLAQRGFTLQKLKDIGFDVVDLAGSAHVANGFCSAFGADAVIEAFLRRPSDAVMIVATPAQEALSLSSEKLLRVCAGCPEEACLVIKQAGVQGLRGVRAQTLLDAGMNARLLSACSHGIVSVSQQVLGDPQQLVELGFTLGL